jgi:hypothetical protein
MTCRSTSSSAILLFLIAAFLGLQTPAANAQGGTVEASSCLRLLARVPTCTPTKRFLPACVRTAACTLNGRRSNVCTAWKCQRIL